MTPGDDALSSDVRELLDASVDSVDGLDALMLLHREAGRRWKVGEVAQALDIDVGSAQRALAELRSRGLAYEVGDDDDGAYRMAQLTPLSSHAFAALERACGGNRRAVVEYLGRRSMGRLRILAEAFTRRRRAP